MALYRYKAVTVAGEIVEGQFDVASNDEAIAKIQDAGNIPLDVREATDGAGGSLSLLRRSAIRGVPRLPGSVLEPDLR